MNIVVVIAICVLYIAIGAFVAKLLGDEDYPGFAITFWPIIVGLWLAMFVVLIVPCWVVDRVRDLRKRGGKKK